ncbi:phytoene desaturase family protein [Plantactinospora sp. KLBMP9567]|uniref:phytoene desaturase family protein n=1 Tax=Plantactinospora sp. KLBMP9567 TaxID=3085900 RepID=UPI0029812CBF|nr:phytoene desaturase family protein [Plantactinospora sp. KLBMP9567]MDW5323044.1 phytoene desaturase family protein [Plantactinospora sp. KLBMP9567]
MSRVVVIGAGVGGLAAAARLAALGHEVAVYERSDVVGGKLGRYVRETPVGTFRFDTGPSLLTLPQVFADLFEATGAKLDEYLDLMPLDPIVRHVFPPSSIEPPLHGPAVDRPAPGRAGPGTVLDSCADPEVFAARIAERFGAESADDWRRLWRRAERVWTASWRDVLRRPVDSPRDLAKLSWRLGDLAAIAPGRTLRDLGRRHLRDPRLRMLLDRYATYTGADPRRAPAALAAIPYAELTFGGWYPRGGLGALADALLSRCLDLGVVVATGSTVTGIDAAGGRVHGVRLAGAVNPVPADVVVANTDALTLYRDLLPTPDRLARLTDRSLAGFVLLLGVRGESGLAHHNVFFPADYDAEFDAVFGDPGRGVPARPVADPTVFVSVPDDPLVRPAGHEAWFVLVNAPRQGRTLGGVDWRRPGLADAYADRVLEVLADRGVDVRDRLVFRETRTPDDLASTAGAPGGAIHGSVGGLLRPANRGPARGLFLVGGSTHPGGGLPLVALSAQIVAGEIGRA